MTLKDILNLAPYARIVVDAADKIRESNSLFQTAQALGEAHHMIQFRRKLADLSQEEIRVTVTPCPNDPNDLNDSTPTD